MIDLVREAMFVANGGRQFFNYLDNKVMERPEFYNWAAQTAYALYGDDIKFVVTGKWGREFQKYMGLSAVWLPGGLRDMSKDRIRAMGPMFRPDWPDTQYVYLDDSFYSGRTLNAARDIVPNIIGAVVVYDGGHHGLPDVASLYRWRDR